MVRVTRSLSYLLPCFLLLTLFYIYQPFCFFSSSNSSTNTPSHPSGGPQEWRSIDCFLNRKVVQNLGLKSGSTTVKGCRSDGEEVYVPFTWVEQQYEAKGEWVDDEDEETEFDISLSYSRVFPPKFGHYNSTGPFMHFENFKVEARSRVKCVSAQYGVPVSSQWDPAGYFYPTQISQFGLAHYSLSLKGVEGRRKVFEDGRKHQLDLTGSSARRLIDEERNVEVIEYHGELNVDLDCDLPYVSMDWVGLGKGGEVVLVLEVKGEQKRLIYRVGKDSQHLVNLAQERFHGLGPSGKWIRLAREVALDLEKVEGRKVRGEVTIVGLEFRGDGRVANISCSQQEHRALFLAAADWLVESQSIEGGWPSKVVFNKDSRKYPGAKELDAGWVGAMCQGQAISLLIRAAHASGNEVYKVAATRAVRVFNTTVEQGGVVEKVLGRYIWFEEYPTIPSAHILNGFLYALLGLWDLGQEEVLEARLAYNRGMASLITLLPLFDTGSGTFYDLRHLEMGGPPKGARWDYHATHVNQVLLLAKIEGDGERGALLRTTGERWRGYMLGLKAPHN